MGRNNYQLVAIDENKVEYIIELKNKNNKKGHLSLLDYGTSFFKSEEQMKNYFLQKKLNFPKNCSFKIKYPYDGEIKYLSVIYDEPELNKMLRNKYSNKENIFEKRESEQVDYEQKVFAIKLLEEVEKLLKNPEFLKTFDLYMKNRLGMSDIVNEKIQTCMYQYAYLVNLPILEQDEQKEKEDIKHSIIRELTQYKQFRTLYLFVKEYKNGKINVDEEELDLLSPEEQRELEEEYLKIRQSEKKKEGTWDFEEKLVVPHEINEAYKNGGMDEVYGQYDLDDLIVKGLRR